MQRYFAAGVRKGNAIEFPGGAATPSTFAIAVRLGAAVWVWNTPIALDIVRNEGASTAVQAETVRIFDVTRWALWGVGFVALIAGAGLASRAQPKE